MGGLVELDRALGILAEHAVDDTDVEVEVSIERRAEAMKKRDRADLGMGTGSRTRMSEHSPNGPQEDAQHSAGDRGVVVQKGSDALRNGEHPLAHRKRRQDVIDEMGGGLDHTASVTGRTYAAALATERDQEVVATAGAAGASEAVRQNTAAQIGPEVSLDPRRDAAPHGIRLGGLCEKGLEVVLHQRKVTVVTTIVRNRWGLNAAVGHTRHGTDDDFRFGAVTRYDLTLSIRVPGRGGRLSEPVPFNST